MEEGGHETGRGDTSININREPCLTKETTPRLRKLTDARSSLNFNETILGRLLGLLGKEDAILGKVTKVLLFRR